MQLVAVEVPRTVIAIDRPCLAGPSMQLVAVEVPRTASGEVMDAVLRLLAVPRCTTQLELVGVA